MEPNVLTAQRDEKKNVLEVVNSSLAESYNVNHNDVVNSVTESLDLITKRDKIQQQISALESYFDAEGHSDMSPCSSTDADSDDDDEDEGGDDVLDNERGLDAKHEKIQREIKQLEESLGLGAEDIQSDNVGSTEMALGSICTSDEYSDEEDLEIPLDTETCLEMNLVYQEVVKEKLSELEQLLKGNRQQQREMESQIHGSATPDPALPSSRLFIGNFMKPYFKDKDTALGPPANPETREKMLSGTQPCDEKKIKRWEGWQKSLLISAIVQDTMKRLLQPKMSKMEYFRDKITKVGETEKEILQKQIQQLDVEIAKISALKEEDLMGELNDDHDWDKISNIDFEGKRFAEDLQTFWQNYLHPSINKSPWKPEEIEKLKCIAEEYQGYNWEKIAEKMETNRTAFMCFQTYQNYIYKEFRRRAWTKEEDAQLRDLVQKKRIGNFIPYTQMSYFIDGRDAGQVMYRWTQVLDPSIKKGTWCKEEDELLLKAIEKHGVPNWWRIRYDVPGRTDAQCRDRYVDCISEDVKKGPWSPEEENKLTIAVQKYGAGKWAKIATEIPHRTDSQCLHKWRSISKYKRPRHFLMNKQAKRRTVRKKAQSIVKKDDEEQNPEEEIEYMESDESEEKEEEPEPSKPKYVQPILSGWIPRQTDTALATTDILRIIFFKPPISEDPVQSRSQTMKPIYTPSAHYTVLDRTGRPVDHYKAKQYQTPKRRTFDEEMILVPQADIKNLFPLVGARVLKLQEPSDRGAGEGAIKCSNAGTLQEKRRVEAKFLISFQDELKEALSLWMGNVLLPLPISETQTLEVDVVRERAAKVELSSTAVFLLLLKTLHIDTGGCKKVISARKTPALTGTHRNPGVFPSTARQMILNKNMKLKKPTKNASVSSQLSHIKQLQPQLTWFQLQHPQQVQLHQPKPTQSPPHLDGKEAQPQTALHVQPCGDQLTKPQPRFTQMPQLLLPHSNQLGQPVLMSWIPPQSTCSMPLSNANATKPSKRARKPTVKAKELIKEADASAIKPSKRARKPTVKAKELIEEEDTKAKNRSRHKRPRLEETFPAVSPVAWIITPSAPTSLNTQDKSMLAGNSMLTLPAAGSVTFSSSGTFTHHTTQANIPLNPPSVFPSAVFCGSSDVPVLTPLMTMPAVTIPSLVNTNVPSTTVTTSWPSVQSGCSSGSQSTLFFTVPFLSSSPALPSTSETVQRAPLPKGRLLAPSPAAPVQPTAATFPQHAVKPLPAVNQNPPQNSHFDPNLMFLEDEVTIQDWMKGRNGIVIPQSDKPQPYLPPFVSNINTLQCLLKATTTLSKHSLRVLPNSRGEAEGDGMSEEQLVAVRKIVVERFSCNPAYLSLKARFLSCFTVPALLATIDPAKDLDPDPPFTDTSEHDELKV